MTAILPPPPWLPPPDWQVRPRMVCLTCVHDSAIKASALADVAVLGDHEPVSRDHRGHLLIVAYVFETT